MHCGNASPYCVWHGRWNGVTIFHSPAIGGDSHALRDRSVRAPVRTLSSPATADASAEGKRMMLLGTANTNPYIGAWTSTFSRFATQPA